MDKPLIARASIHIDAPLAKVWEALVTPELITQYLFGTTAVSDWKDGGCERMRTARRRDARAAARHDAREDTNERIC